MPHYSTPLIDKLLKNNLFDLNTMDEGPDNHPKLAKQAEAPKENKPLDKFLSLHFRPLKNPNYGEIYLSPLYVELILAKYVDQEDVELVEENSWGLSLKQKPTSHPFSSLSTMLQWCTYIISGDQTVLFPICFTSNEPYLLTRSHHLYLANYRSPYIEDEENNSSPIESELFNSHMLHILLSDTMEPLLSYLIWCDKQIYLEFTKPAYLNSSYFGLGSLFLRQHQMSIMGSLKSEGLFNRRQFLEKLSLLLSNITETMSEHFLEVMEGKKKLNKTGQRIFAYLSVMFSLPLPDDFKATCNMFPKLKAFCSFINNKYSIWKEDDYFLLGLGNLPKESKISDFDINTTASFYRFSTISFVAIMAYMFMKKFKQ